MEEDGESLFPVVEDSGTLNENTDSLFVFGYEAKIFRDDEKADWIERGGHLIPWMGDHSLMIDRYDVRAALPHLSPYESRPDLGEETQSEEAMLDAERYKDLLECENDDKLYQEEEFKRLQQAVNGMVEDSNDNDKPYAAISYSYDESGSTSSFGPEPKTDVEEAQEDSPFCTPAGLIVPPDITLPLTMKSHVIIEKTAKFIASQGSQMEIILKMKQSGNSQFNFLNYSDPLNSYYKYLVQSIRSNAYVPTSDDTNASNFNVNESESQSSDSDSEDNSGYLHPSLFSSASSSTSNAPSVSFKKCGSNPYSMLVSKIQSSAPASSNTDKNRSTAHYHSLKKPKAGHVSGWDQFIDFTNNPSNVNDSKLFPPKGYQKQMPTSQEALIIEKMAQYAVKNGTEFESLARTKGDTRFVFLQTSHPLHWYYLNCKQRLKATVASSNFVSYTSSSSKPSNGSSNKGPENVNNGILESLKRINRPQHKLPPELVAKIDALKRARVQEEERKKLALNEELQDKESAISTTISENKNDKTKLETDKCREEERIKCERRRKAALFLQQLKRRKETTNPSTEKMAEKEITETKSISRVSAGTTTVDVCSTIEQEKTTAEPDKNEREIVILPDIKRSSNEEARGGSSRRSTPSDDRRERKPCSRKERVIERVSRYRYDFEATRPSYSSEDTGSSDESPTSSSSSRSDSSYDGSSSPFTQRSKRKRSYSHKRRKKKKSKSSSKKSKKKRRD